MKYIFLFFLLLTCNFSTSSFAAVEYHTNTFERVGPPVENKKAKRKRRANPRNLSLREYRYKGIKAGARGVLYIIFGAIFLALALISFTLAAVLAFGTFNLEAGYIMLYLGLAMLALGLPLFILGIVYTKTKGIRRKNKSKTEINRGKATY